jgi:hypothetical protein
MGKALTSLLGNDGVSVSDIFIDFEKAECSEAEREVYDGVAKVLDRSGSILEDLLKYEGCEEKIRTAITTPSPEAEEAAWEAVLPAVEQLQQFYDFSLELESAFPKLLVALCKDDPKDTLSNQQALTKLLADVFDFVLLFDDAKMVNPAIQNDFSYYRRTLNRMKMAKKDLNIKIRDELANRMSLFFAYPTPMMKVLSETTAKFLETDTTVPRDNVNNALALMANCCHDMVVKKKFDSDETNMFCLRCMTGAIILFDHLHPAGAFSKKSNINMKGAITALKGHTSSPTDGLLNALRFTTIHLNDAETPNSLKQMLN